MKRLLLFILFSASFSLYAQVINYPKTLPFREWSVGLTSAYNFDRDVVLFDEGGPSLAVNAGYGIQYSLDVNMRFNYFFSGSYGRTTPGCVIFS